MAARIVGEAHTQAGLPQVRVMWRDTAPEARPTQPISRHGRRGRPATPTLTPHAP